MPTYDYRCKQCGHEFELFQSMSDGVKRKCPECKKSSLERLIGAGAGLIFKGSGYYLTDYRSKSYQEGAKAEKDAAQKASGGDAQPTGDKKPAGDSAGKDTAKPAKAPGTTGPQKKSGPKKRRS